MVMVDRDNVRSINNDQVLLEITTITHGMVWLWSHWVLPGDSTKDCNLFLCHFVCWHSFLTKFIHYDFFHQIVLLSAISQTSQLSVCSFLLLDVPYILSGMQSTIVLIIYIISVLIYH